jgi:hypothetical protein
MGTESSCCPCLLLLTDLLSDAFAGCVLQSGRRRRSGELQGLYNNRNARMQTCGRLQLCTSCCCLQELADSFSVATLPTVVLVKAGQEVHRVVGKQQRAVDNMAYALICL